MFNLINFLQQRFGSCITHLWHWSKKVQSYNCQSRLRRSSNISTSMLTFCWSKLDHHNTFKFFVVFRLIRVSRHMDTSLICHIYFYLTSKYETLLFYLYLRNWNSRRLQFQYDIKSNCSHRKLIIYSNLECQEYQ